MFQVWFNITSDRTPFPFILQRFAEVIKKQRNFFYCCCFISFSIICARVSDSIKKQTASAKNKNKQMTTTCVRSMKANDQLAHKSISPSPSTRYRLGRLQSLQPQWCINRGNRVFDGWRCRPFAATAAATWRHYRDPRAIHSGYFRIRRTPPNQCAFNMHIA